ncbi:acetyltransferase [Capsaspora owczarzaki ATCC 30864]|uniref:Acetyltransferase n=1 Tax=Capsaspora owczarzaki (strain ATCC 30864) TaxID=595528 RepID=A0A0D2WVT0_CAPO3|nr:acetyltransferase [Capsaspora owczarzaki ATCC 30864]KJE96403.1 acetyltransferase [Capsaspora owczarzaki ATCC 30864]|eukprot:XP_004344356.2 acetyltransferase [Capsaspora owczarzaki ATCC 30864]
MTSFQFIDTVHPLYEGERQLRFDVLLSTVGLAKYSFEHMDAASYHLVAVELVESKETVVGCVLFHPEPLRRRTGRLFQMAVAKHRQGTGLGMKLVQALETRLAEDGFFTLTLHARAHAVPFYERCGYSCVGEPFHEVGLEHRHMRRAIRPLRAIAFDCGGILAADCNYTMLFEHVHQDKVPAVKAAIDAEWDKFKLDSTYPTQLFWANVLQAATLDPSDWERFDIALVNFQTAFWGTFAIVERLRKRYPEIILGVVSNYNQSWFEAIFVKYGLASLFPDRSLVVVSCDVAAAKPDHRILDVFLARVNAVAAGSAGPIPKDSAVLIDDKKRNTDAAHKHGMVGLQYNAAKEPSGVLVSRLRELGLDVSEEGVDPL